MTSICRATIAARVSQCLAATAIMTGIAIGAAAIAGATFNRDAYDRCIIRGGYLDECCIYAGGGVIYDAEGYPIGCSIYDPVPEAENVPQPPGQSTPPPVLQNPPQTSNPLIPTPRGPNSGTIG
jgi:hypothetical protein